MKIKTEKKELQVIGAESKQFSVDTSDTMVIRLLRDKMYRNKIGAVCREISSNSRDANREAGRGTTPIVITINEDNKNLLSEENITISFQDNGIGISPERMDKIFLKYGSSTKRDSDKFTGGFGIGAKTPFAYTDNFFIETVVEEGGKRTKYQYQATISSDGTKEISSMVCLFDEETTEQTGTKIIVPIKDEKDREEFEKEVVYATSLWKEKPILNNFSFEAELEKVYEDDKFLIIRDKKDFYGDNKYIALIDGIPYCVSNREITSRSSNIETSLRLKLKWCIKLETSEMTVSGSREDIEYTNENLNKIVSSIKTFSKDKLSLIDEYRATAKSFLEACTLNSLLDRFTNTYSYNLSVNEYGNFKGAYIAFLGQIAYSNGFNNSESKMYTEFKGKKTFRSPNFKTLHFDVKIPQNGKMITNKYASLNIDEELWGQEFYLMDIEKAEPTRNAMLKKLHPDGYVVVSELTLKEINSGYRVVFGSVEAYEEARKRDYEILEMLSKNLKKYSEVEKLRNVKEAERKKSDIVGVNIRVYNHNKYHDRSWEGIVVNYDKANEDFINLEEAISQLLKIKNGTFDICYFVKENLNAFNEGRQTDWSSVAGMTLEENSIRKILFENGTIVIGVSSSKSGYFKEMPTMAEKMIELIKDDEKGKMISDVLKNKVIKEKNLHNSYTALIGFDKATKVSFDKLKNILKETQNEISNKIIYKTTSEILGSISLEFLNEFGLKLDDDFMKDLNNVNNFFIKNPMMNFILEKTSETGGMYISTSDKNFKEAIKDYFEKQRKSIEK
jgi:hypothetical protein